MLMMNVKRKVNFRRDTKWFDPPGDQVKFLEEALEDEMVVNPVGHPRLEAQEQLEAGSLAMKHGSSWPLTTRTPPRVSSGTA